MPGTLIRKWELRIYEGWKFRIVGAMPLFVITKEARWDVAKHIQIPCHTCSH